MKKILISMLCIGILCVSFTGCGQTNVSNFDEHTDSAYSDTTATEPLKDDSIVESVSTEPAAPAIESNINLESGEYLVDFDTDSAMFHLNESKKGKAILTVSEDGSASLHITLVSKKIVNSYVGLAENAPTDEENWLQPTNDAVTYDDGYEEEVYGFDVPVVLMGEEFDLAILGEKGTWYDHKASFSNPEKVN